MKVRHSGASQFVGSTKFHQDDKIREDGSVKTCSMHGKSEKGLQNFISRRS
jgi:hypothetical protein